MCSISTNQTVNDQLEKLEHSNDRDMIESRLSKFAKESNINSPGILDNPKFHMRRMPPELKDVKKIQIGRHRIYYTGHHNMCSYCVFYIKQFKKSDVNQEDDKKFQNKLIRFLEE